MAKRGYRRPEPRTASVETGDDEPSDVPGDANSNGHGNGTGRTPFGLGAAALTWRDRIAALGVERRAREVAFLDSAISDRTKQLRRLKENVAELEEDLRDRTPLRNELEILRAERAALEADLERLRHQRLELESAPEELTRAKAELEQLRAELILARSERHDLDRVRAELAFEVQDLREQAGAQQRAASHATEELEKLNCHIDRARAELETSTAEEREQLEKLEIIRAQASEESTALAALQRQTDAAREVLDGLSRERCDLDAAIKELASERRRMDEEASELEVARRDRQANLARLDDELLALHHSLGAARTATDTELERLSQAKIEKEQLLDQIEAEIRDLQQRKRAEDQALEARVQEQDRVQAVLAQLDATIEARNAELELLASRKNDLESEVAALIADQAEQQRQRQLCLDELANIRGHLKEAGERLVILRDLLEEREHDLSALREAAETAQTEHDTAFRLRVEELADTDSRIRQSCETLAGITAELESRQRDLDTLRTACKEEAERLAKSQGELQAHLIRKETELRMLETNVAASQETLVRFLADREQRQQEAQSRLAQVLTKRKVAEDDLAAKLQQLEQANASLAQAGEAQITLARTLADSAKAHTELAKLESRLQLRSEEQCALEEKLVRLRDQSAALEGIDFQLASRDEELCELEGRVKVLQERAHLLGPAASLAIGTIHVLATDLITELDHLDAQILNFRRFACDHDFAAELERVRQSLLDLLERYGVSRFELAEAGARPGYRHLTADGTETILRSAAVITGRS